MEIVLHDRELDLMEVLWERGSATAAEVRDALKDPLAYNTVLTILRRMEDKGYLRHEEEGRAHRYIPLIEREQASRKRPTAPPWTASSAALPNCSSPN